MRTLAIIFAALVLAACSIAQVSQPQSKADSSSQQVSPELQNASADSAEQFLLTSAATDFHAHGPSHIESFRDVRMGHVRTPDGKEQYFLCGQLLSSQEGGKARWTPFATIKTSGYEQYLGPRAVSFCQDSSAVWDKVGDLSSLLRSRLESLR